MNFFDYQIKARKTAIYPKEYSIIYPALELVNEAGEVAGKIKKVLRDKGGDFDWDDKEKIGDEIGDVLWAMAALCHDLGLNMDNLAENNISKLKDRQERGVLGGSGDDR